MPTDSFQKAVDCLLEGDLFFPDPDNPGKYKKARDDPKYAHIQHFSDKFGHLPPQFRSLHLYRYQNVLRPRGSSLSKESLSSTIYDRLKGAFESWTDPKYGDNPDVHELMDTLERNLHEEVQAAWDEFWGEHAPQPDYEE